MDRKRKQSKNSATCSERWATAEIVVNNIDLLTEILLRLPAKSLMRFKSVSKLWRSHISGSYFSSTHIQRNPKFLSSALYSVHRKLFPLSHTSASSHSELSFLDGLENSNRIEVKDSCNGLLLCHYYKYYRDGYRYIVCNPTTRSYRLLPDRECFDPQSFQRSRMVMACFGFDSSKSSHYNVVVVQFRCHRKTRSGSFEIDVYQSELSSWEQRLKFDVPGAWGKIYKFKSFWNGAIHWISQLGYHIRFDPHSKKLTGVKLPVYPTVLEIKEVRYFGESDGRLFLIHSRKRCPLRFEVLEMGGDDSSWVAKYTVNLTDLMSVVPDLHGSLMTRGFHVLSILKVVEREDLSLLLLVDRQVISYSLHCKAWKVLLNLPDSDSALIHFFGNDGPYPFFESLAPV